MKSANWQPGAPRETLVRRAQILARIRQFFADRAVLEVETPVFSSASVTDVHLHSFTTSFNHPLEPYHQNLFLQTSPEFAMKRLLCAGSGAIYQLCKAFRNEEGGRYHNPEFTMLEWYRPGFDHLQLMAEVDQLLQSVLATEPAEQISYQQVFLQHLNIDPLSATLAELKQVCMAQGFSELAQAEQDPDTLLQLLFSEKIEPLIAQQRPCFVYAFPASQAALARIDDHDPRTARRFEVYFRGIELANGFHELDDPVEQRSRFEADNARRQTLGLPQMPIDERLLAALSHGLPDCAGVALGVDRLIMLATGASRLSEVVAFDISRS